MANKGQVPDPDHGALSPAERDAIKRRAADLGRRLDEVHARKNPQAVDVKARGNALGQAFKILTELVVGVVVGGGIGWVLDRQLGTAPWLMILFLVVGFAAGMSNVVRTARRLQAQSEPLQRAAPSVPDDDDDVDGGKRGNSPPGRPSK